MNKPFTDQELEIINRANEADLGPMVEHLTPLELLRLKSGEGISLKMIVKGRGLLAAAKIKSGGSAIEYVTRDELNAIMEEHNNLAVKTMLIFMALEQRGIISDKDLYDVAAKLKDGPDGGQTDVGKDDSKTRTRKRGPRAAKAKK
jgi:hypothetical protein